MAMVWSQCKRKLFRVETMANQSIKYHEFWPYEKSKNSFLRVVFEPEAKDTGDRVS